jgi:hypothetical protein
MRDFWVGVLQLLVAVYQVRSARSPKIDVLISLQEEIRTSPPENPRAFIQERLDAELPAADAASVQADLSTFDLLIDPFEPQAFDYWNVLDRLMTSIRDFCHRSNSFRLRGLGDTIGDRLLKLPKTSAAIFEEESRNHWLNLRYYSRGCETRGTQSATLYLVETPTTPRLPYGVKDDVYLSVVGFVVAQYVEYGYGGYSGPPPL